MGGWSKDWMSGPALLSRLLLRWREGTQPGLPASSRSPHSHPRTLLPRYPIFFRNKVSFGVSLPPALPPRGLESSSEQFPLWRLACGTALAPERCFECRLSEGRQSCEPAQLCRRSWAGVLGLLLLLIALCNLPGSHFGLFLWAYDTRYLENICAQ